MALPVTFQDSEPVTLPRSVYTKALSVNGKCNPRGWTPLVLYAKVHTVIKTPKSNIFERRPIPVTIRQVFLNDPKRFKLAGC